MQPNVLVIDFVNTSTLAHDTALVNQIIAGATEASRMQGFKNPSQPSQLRYQVAKFVDLRDGVNGRPAAPAGFPYQNSTLFPAAASVRSSKGSVSSTSTEAGDTVRIRTISMRSDPCYGRSN